MDISKNNIFILNGYIVSSFNYLNKGKIYKIYTDNLGLISIYSKDMDFYLSNFSEYNFTLTKGREFFYLKEYDLLKYNHHNSKKYFLFLNIISEIILKTMLFEMENFAIYSLISEILNLYSDENYIDVLIYFVFNYLSLSGYYITFDNLNNKKYYFDIEQLEVNSYSNYFYKNRFQYDLTDEEVKLLKSLYYNEIKFEGKSTNINNRLFGILINALCINFGVSKFNTFNLFS
ncbi:MAG: DNA recombination protein RecO [Peptoniphilaceae bacterium]|uniref:DNA recombination protein RecO n=1 Tax=Parvimonas sp. TaxID=1944660 RepID=UPI0025DAA1B1|nr:DNA recombination protein RecO [Parvimonas sp.]MCI5997513.1 DNA recombination protein RecO [Parvimonas sp.]MDD7764622.1 DNA recombination protein RecO [Peptoniphilaceae bacterium]MDY3050598.1 DNA recombination protein RecO [Parvimonas sp.]